MTQAYNLSQLANKVNTSGQIDVTTALSGTVAVSSGGTGQTTYSNGQILIGNSSGGLTKATITAGTGISVTNGNGSITIASSSLGQLQYALYTSGSGTWICPNNVTRIRVTVVGGGGGGSEDGEPGYLSIGGIGGAASGIYTVTPGSGYNYSVGAGGVGGATAGTGGTSSLTGICSATGGTGGIPGGFGVSGSGSNGVFVNTTASSFSPPYGGPPSVWLAIPPFFGKGYRQTGPSSPITWVVTSGFVPGAAGSGYSGGVGGVIYIEYIG
jgi:hypothetical protein